MYVFLIFLILHLFSNGSFFSSYSCFMMITFSQKLKGSVSFLMLISFLNYCHFILKYPMKNEKLFGVGRIDILCYFVCKSFSSHLDKKVGF